MEELNWFVANKCAKKTKKNDFSLTIIISELQQQRIKQKYKKNKKFQACQSFVTDHVNAKLRCQIKDVELRFGNNGYNKTFGLKKPPSLCIRFKKKTNIDLSAQQTAFLEGYLTGST